MQTRWNSSTNRKVQIEKDILLQVLEDHTNEELQTLQEYAITADIIALMNAIPNKSSNSEFAELFVKRI